MNLRVKEICRERGITMEKLASVLDITPNTLTRNINGNPTIETLEKISKALDVSFIDLFEQPEKDGLIGIVRYNGKPYEINSISDIENLLQEIKGEGRIPNHENIRGKEYYK